MCKLLSWPPTTRPGRRHKARMVGSRVRPNQAAQGCGRAGSDTHQPGCTISRTTLPTEPRTRSGEQLTHADHSGHAISCRLVPEIVRALSELRAREASEGELRSTGRKTAGGGRSACVSCSPGRQPLVPDAGTRPGWWVAGSGPIRPRKDAAGPDLIPTSRAALPTEPHYPPNP